MRREVARQVVEAYITNMWQTGIVEGLHAEEESSTLACQLVHWGHLDDPSCWESQTNRIAADVKSRRALLEKTTKTFDTLLKDPEFKEYAINYLVDSLVGDDVYQLDQIMRAQLHNIRIATWHSIFVDLSATHS